MACLARLMRALLQKLVGVAFKCRSGVSRDSNGGCNSRTVGAVLTAIVLRRQPAARTAHAGRTLGAFALCSPTRMGGAGGSVPNVAVSAILRHPGIRKADIRGPHAISCSPVDPGQWLRHFRDDGYLPESRPWHGIRASCRNWQIFSRNWRNLPTGTRRASLKPRLLAHDGLARSLHH